jgi:hypothetical protein
MNPDLYPEQVLDRISEILFPAGDLDHEWNPGHLERIAEAVLEWKDGGP